MRELWRWIVILIAFYLAGPGTDQFSLAQGESHGESNRHKQYRNHPKGKSTRYFDPVNNETYKNECGACHFAYPPGLLPSGSWEKIITRLNDHFGVEVIVDQAPKEVIAGYLKSNAAERSTARQAARIMECLGNLTPLRITEIPYIRKKHEDLSRTILERDSEGSLSNCSACHKTADKGIFDDDSVESSE